MPKVRGHAFGLRGRIVGVVLFTAVATLAVAALALLGPLEQSLRNSEKTTLRKGLGPGRVEHEFGGLRYDQVTTDPAARKDVLKQQSNLEQRLDAHIVQVRHDPGVDGTGSQPVVGQSEDNDSNDDSLNDVAQAFRTGKRVFSFGTIDGLQYARAAIPFNSGAVRYVLAVRKSIAEIPSVFHVVRRAFIDAALAGLVLTLLLGIPLSGRLVRRLRRLRQAALELAHEGPSVEVPVDRARDEVGDLARTLTTMQHRLQQQEEARRAFVATASHELRTPLTSLDGMLELLSEDLRDDHPDLEDARALVERAHAQSRRLGRLAANLLDLSRLDAQVRLRSEPVELGELSRAVLAEFELRTEQRDIRSRLDDLDGSVWALGDPGSIAQILRILLDNAIRASPAGSAVAVTLKRQPEAAISVSDEGPGVPVDEREAIFDRFHRGPDRSGQAGFGFGLGLAIGRELAHRMGGELILVQDDRPGATFMLKLPMARAPEHEPVMIV